jgi:hypothetical protein
LVRIFSNENNLKVLFVRKIVLSYNFLIRQIRHIFVCCWARELHLWYIKSPPAKAMHNLATNESNFFSLFSQLLISAEKATKITSETASYESISSVQKVCFYAVILQNLFFIHFFDIQC